MKSDYHFAGIWLDFREAKLIAFSDDKGMEIKQIRSDIDEGKAKGGSRSKTPWGPMDNVSESGHQRRRDQQITKYMERICQALDDIPEIAIIGPGEAKSRLGKHLAHRPSSKAVIKFIEPADVLSDKQLAAKFRSMIDVK